MSDESNDSPQETYEATVALLKPALERVVSDPEFRARLEAAPLSTLDDMGIELDAQTRAELEGKRFTEFWAARRKRVEEAAGVKQGPVGSARELPPRQDASGELSDGQLDAVGGGTRDALDVTSPGYSPPYVPVGPVVFSEVSQSTWTIKKR